MRQRFNVSMAIELHNEQEVTKEWIEAQIKAALTDKLHVTFDSLYSSELTSGDVIQRVTDDVKELSPSDRNDIIARLKSARIERQKKE